MFKVGDKVRSKGFRTDLLKLDTTYTVARVDSANRISLEEIMSGDVIYSYDMKYFMPVEEPTPQELADEYRKAVEIARKHRITLAEMGYELMNNKTKVGPSATTPINEYVFQKTTTETL